MRCATIRTLVVGLIAMAGWELAGCVTLNKEFPVKTTYALEVMRRGPDPVPQGKAVLKVRKFRVAPRFDGRGLVYRLSEQRYESDYYHEWFIAPNAMVTQQVQNWLAASGLFAHVVASGSTADETHVLEGTVAILYGDFREPAHPKALLEIQIVLLDAGALDGGILSQRDYRREVALPAPTPEALVQGWNDALRDALTDAEADLAKTLSRPSGERPPNGRQGTAPSRAPATIGE